jgi:hypothetical protein
LARTLDVHDDVSTDAQLYNINSTDYNVYCNAVLALLVHSHPTDFESGQVSTNLFNNVSIPKKLSLGEMFTAVHGGRQFHRGIKSTWIKLNEQFPGHAIPIRVVAELVSECPTCQKVRLSYEYTLPSENHTLKPTHYRKRIGVDTLTITPKDRYGNYLAIVVVEHFSKFCSIYPCASHEAKHTATAMFLHYTRYGAFEEVLTDPGSDFMSETIVLLNTYLGQEQKVSKVGRHQSNGVEPTNKKILGLIRTLAHDERIRHDWSDPTIIGMIEYACNSQYHSEINAIPMELKFGTADFAYHHMPDNDIITNNAPDVLIRFNDHLKIIRSLSREYQLSLVEKRDNSISTNNKYQPGDFVLFIYSVEGERLNKMDAAYLGPYVVLTHVRNDVKVRNLITDAVNIYHSDRLKPFYGTREQAKEAALRDAEQYYIEKFLAYRGDPQVRTTIEFYVEFVDGSKHWKVWSKDLFDTIQYENFCNSLPQLSPLVTLQRESLILIKQLNISPIDIIKPGDTVYMDLRAIGAQRYSTLSLPDLDFSMYVVPLIYKSWQNQAHTRVNCYASSLKLEWSGNTAASHFFVKSWGSCKQVTSNMSLISLEMIREHDLINAIHKK